MSAFRTPKGVEDETFVRLAADALKHYSDDILQQMVSTRNGLIVTSRFMPSIAEMVEFCQQTAYVPSPPPKPNNWIEPPPIPPEERERVQTGFATLLKSLTASKVTVKKDHEEIPVDTPAFEENIRYKMEGVVKALREADKARLGFPDTSEAK